METSLGQDEIRLLAGIADRMGPLVDRVLEVARQRVPVEGERPVSVAALAKELRRMIDTSPEGWALLVADLSLRAAEPVDPGRVVATVTASVEVGSSTGDRD